MVNITLSVSEGLKEKMDRFPEINWSEVAREAIKTKVTQMAVFKSIVSKSKLTEEDALEIGTKVNERLAKRYKELMKSSGKR